jgi:hypothetical protein
MTEAAAAAAASSSPPTTTTTARLGGFLGRGRHGAGRRPVVVGPVAPASAGRHHRTVAGGFGRVGSSGRRVSSPKFTDAAAAVRERGDFKFLSPDCCVSRHDGQMVRLSSFATERTCHALLSTYRLVTHPSLVSSYSLPLVLLCPPAAGAALGRQPRVLHRPPAGRVPVLSSHRRRNQGRVRHLRRRRVGADTVETQKPPRPRDTTDGSAEAKGP